MLKIASVLGVSVELLYGRKEPISLHTPPEPRERRLLDSFRSLNDEGKKKALDDLDDLVDTGKYKKRDPVGMAQEA